MSDASWRKKLSLKVLTFCPVFLKLSLNLSSLSSSRRNPGEAVFAAFPSAIISEGGICSELSASFQQFCYEFTLVKNMFPAGSRAEISVCFSEQTYQMTLMLCLNDELACWIAKGWQATSSTRIQWHNSIWSQRSCDISYWLEISPVYSKSFV